MIPATYLPPVLGLTNAGHVRDPIPRRQQAAIVAWSGMRGVVSLAAAFALPLTLSDGNSFPGRNYILFLTFSVILTTLVLQGLSLPLLIRKLGITYDGEADEEERRARVEANEAAIELIGKLRASGEFSTDTVDRLRAEYDERLERLQLCADEPRRLPRRNRHAPISAFATQSATH